MEQASSKGLSPEYDMGRLLDEGSYGVVHRATRVNDGTSVVVKKLIRADLLDAVKEVDILQQLDHPSIVKLCDVIVRGTVVHMVFPDCGRDLAEHPKRRAARKHSEPEARQSVRGGLVRVPEYRRTPAAVGPHHGAWPRGGVEGLLWSSDLALPEILSIAFLCVYEPLFAFFWSLPNRASPSFAPGAPSHVRRLHQGSAHASQRADTRPRASLLLRGSRPGQLGHGSATQRS